VTLCRKLEADFRQIYHADLRDLFDEDSEMTIRWVIDMIDELPSDSRFAKELRNDPLSVMEHYQLETVDVINQLLYQASLSAAAALGKEYKNYANKAPKPVDRPKIHEPEEKPKQRFATIHELRDMFSN
jgi:hypothetical protein